jgi:hypothetical protein
MEVSVWVSEMHVSFECPICTCPHDEMDFALAVKRGKIWDHLICRGCKRELHYVIDPSGRVHVWDPSDIKAR